MKIITILGTRPEIIKLSPLIPLLDKEFEHILVHTGQHYDYNMDKVFFEELGLRKPDYDLKVGSGTHAEQTARMMVELEKIILKEKPNWVIVFADPNTPLAGALVAAKLHIPLIHLEAGCRSFNKKMPEEINRIICDHCADLLLAPDETAYKNLLREGLPSKKIHIVGSTDIEASLKNITYARKKSEILKQLNLEKEKFVLLTIHRAENTDDVSVLEGWVGAVNELSNRIKIVFPLHPRTRRRLNENDIKLNEKIKVTEPLGYLDFLCLLDNCKFVMTDSGGIQEEAVALNKPCLILRKETEWTYFTEAGKNMLLGTDKEEIIKKSNYLLDNPEKIEQMKNIQLNLNTKVAEKIVGVIKSEFKK